MNRMRQQGTGQLSMDCNMGVWQQASQIQRKIPHGPDRAVREGFLEAEFELSPQGGVWSGEEQACWGDGVFLPSLGCRTPVC